MYIFIVLFKIKLVVILVLAFVYTLQVTRIKRYDVMKYTQTALFCNLLVINVLFIGILKFIL